MTHPNPRIEAMARAAYWTWHLNLNAPPWEGASEMVKRKFYRMVEHMLYEAMKSQENDAA